MKSRLELFTDAFEDETALRGALHDLLTRLPNVRSVQVTHGAQELGKDLIFTCTGPLGESTIAACVVKNFAISGTVDSPRGAGAVLNQVRQALTAPIISADGSDQRVSRVYVMSPLPVTQIALRSIQGQIHQQSGQVIFVCGAELLSLFETHYPEFLLLKSGLLVSYVEQLRRALSESSAFEHLAFKHGMLASAKLGTSRAYVKPTFSVEIRSLTVALDKKPAEADLERGLTLRELEELERFLGQTAELALYHRRAGVSFHQLSQTESANIVKELHSIGVSIRREWERGLKKRGGERRAVRIPVKHLQRSLESAVKKAIDWSEQLQAASQPPLSYLKAEAAPYKVLASAEYKVYGVYREFSRLRSEACRLGPVFRSIKYDERLVDDLRFPVLITAPAGYGKTSFCKWNALNDAERYARGECDVIPVYVPLHRFARSVPESFNEAFLGDPHLVSLMERSGNKRAEDARLRVYLDGLDEIPRDKQMSVLLLLRRGIRRVKTMQVLLTARDHVTGECLAWLPRVSIERLDSEKVKALVSQLLNSDESRVEEFLHQLDAVPSLRPLMGVPLLATLVVSLFAGMTKLPEGRTELYRIFVDLLCGGWDMAKGLQREAAFLPSDKQRVLTRLASRLQHSRTREASATMLRDAIQEAAPLQLATWEGFVGDMIQDGLLVREAGAYIFNHLSFQEYLCARDLADPGTPDPHRILREYMRGDDWWHEVVMFYLAMSQKPARIRKVLEGIIDEADPGFALREVRQGLTERMEALLRSVKGEFTDPMPNMPRL
jgi:hypothetical protein